MTQFRYPEDPCWNEAREAVEFPVELGEYRGLVILPRRLIHDLVGNRPTPEQCVEYAFMNRTRLERSAEAKLRARLLDAEANIQLTRRDLLPAKG